MGRHHVRALRLLPALLVGLAGVAYGEADYFLSRDGNVNPGSTYLESDGASESDTPVDSPWETFVDEEPAEEDERYQLPGLWEINRTAPSAQTLVAGPTFRNAAGRIEVGAGFGYVNSKWRFPFELSVEPTWRRNKNAPADDRQFRRIRTFGLVNLWNRASNWESTSFSATAFWDNQSSSFNTLEVGGAVSETIGRRWSVSADVRWGADWPNGGDVNHAVISAFGTSYNLGAGLRLGGFYEPYNQLFNDDDFGGFISYQFLPFAELNVNAGKGQFVGVRLMLSYALERPGA